MINSTLDLKDACTSNHDQPGVKSDHWPLNTNVNWTAILTDIHSLATHVTSAVPNLRCFLVIFHRPGVQLWIACGDGLCVSAFKTPVIVALGLGVPTTIIGTAGCINLGFFKSPRSNLVKVDDLDSRSRQHMTTQSSRHKWYKRQNTKKTHSSHHLIHSEKDSPNVTKCHEVNLVFFHCLSTSNRSCGTGELGTTVGWPAVGRRRGGEPARSFCMGLQVWRLQDLSCKFIWNDEILTMPVIFRLSDSDGRAF